VHLRSDSFVPYARIPDRLAFAVHDPVANVRLSANRNPHLQWSGVPPETRSFALLCWDPDVPTVGTDVNRTDRTVPLDLPRADFFHWVIADLPPGTTEIREGEHADGVVPRGKAPGPTPSGGHQGLNDYTGWFATDSAMAGNYCGYDGPCPPFNDERVHGYRFAVFALDTTLGLTGAFTGHQVRAAMTGHVLARALLIGRYAIRPGADR
jgi:Raf kinase inhibitor-like YbhB/YbcL family protein